MLYIVFEFNYVEKITGIVENKTLLRGLIIKNISDKLSSNKVVNTRMAESFEPFRPGVRFF